MHRYIPVSLLKSVVFLDIVKVVSSDHYCPLHLLALDDPCQYSPSYAHIPGKGTLLVNVRALGGLQIESIRRAHYDRQRV